MTDKTDNIELLRTCINNICFLDNSVIDKFLSLFTAHKIDAGCDVVCEGDMGKKIFFVTSGLFRSYYISPKGDESIKHFFLPGTFFAPLTSLITAKPSPVYIGALKDSEYLSADYSELELLYQELPALNILGRKLIEWAWVGKERRETQLIMLDANDRYKAFLKEFPGLDKQIPQYHIASYLGITPVQLSRIRAKFTA